MPTRDLSSMAVEAEFDLDVQIVTDIGPEVSAGCTTNDGCAPTCASACTSNA